mmetsp:Transcript_27388/g.84937  ORF Transcript_27388/g.84937 Transcript_27388/m.84937 type:complete len:310 (+) Transcript_27388:1219-2148(+)
MTPCSVSTLPQFSVLLVAVRMTPQLSMVVMRTSIRKLFPKCLKLDHSPSSSPSSLGRTLANSCTPSTAKMKKTSSRKSEMLPREGSEYHSVSSSIRTPLAFLTSVSRRMMRKMRRTRSVLGLMGRSSTSRTVKKPTMTRKKSKRFQPSRKYCDAPSPPILSSASRAKAMTKATLDHRWRSSHSFACPWCSMPMMMMFSSTMAPVMSSKPVVSTMWNSATRARSSAGPCDCGGASLGSSWPAAPEACVERSCIDAVIGFADARTLPRAVSWSLCSTTTYSPVSALYTTLSSSATAPSTSMDVMTASWIGT